MYIIILAIIILVSSAIPFCNILSSTFHLYSWIQCLIFSSYVVRKVKVKVLVTQSCLTLCDCIDYRLPCSSVHGILQARILEWVATSFSRCDLMIKNLPMMWETHVQYLGSEDPLGKGIATNCNILAWRILWKEESGRLQSMGLQRVWHDCVTHVVRKSTIINICLRNNLAILHLSGKETEAQRR